MTEGGEGVNFGSKLRDVMGAFIIDAMLTWRLFDPPTPSVTLLCPKPYVLVAQIDQPPAHDVICECPRLWQLVDA